MVVFRFSCNRLEYRYKKKGRISVQTLNVMYVSRTDVCLLLSTPASAPVLVHQVNGGHFGLCRKKKHTQLIFLNYLWQIHLNFFCSSPRFCSLLNLPDTT